MTLRRAIGRRSPTGLSSRPVSTAWTRVLWIAGLAAAIAYCAASLLAPDGLLLRVILKPIPVLCLIVWVWRSGAGAYRAGISLGLACAMAGDMFLVGRGETWFLLGLVANLIAHVIYAVTFSLDVRTLQPLRALPFVAWVGGMFVVLQPGLGNLQLPVAVYSVAIAVMMWRAAARVPRGRADRAAWAGAIGAAAFGLSDTLLALNKFHAPIAHVMLPILSTYWLGQLGIARSAQPTEAERT